MNCRCCAAQHDRHPWYASVLERVAHRLLQHTVHTEGNVWREMFWNARSTEVDRHTMPHGEVATEASCCLRQTQQLQLRRMQSLHDDLDFVRKFVGLIGDLPDAVVCARACGQLLSEIVQLYRQQDRS